MEVIIQSLGYDSTNKNMPNAKKKGLRWFLKWVRWLGPVNNPPSQDRMERGRIWSDWLGKLNGERQKRRQAGAGLAWCRCAVDSSGRSWCLVFHVRVFSLPNSSLLSRDPENLVTFYVFHSQLPFTPEKPLAPRYVCSCLSALWLPQLPLWYLRDMTQPSGKENSSPFMLWNGEERYCCC